MPEIKLLLVDDHEMYLEGLRLLLGKDPAFTIVATASTGAELLTMLATTVPDILLCDVHLPDAKPELLLQQIRALQPNLKIIYLTLMRGTRQIHKLVKENINGYILKNAPVAELKEAIHTVYNGGSFFSKELEPLTDSDAYRSTVTVENNKVEEILSKREIEILQLICTEYSNQEIGKKLFLSTGTVDTHRKNIIQKLGVNNTVGLVRYAMRYGLVD